MIEVGDLVCYENTSGPYLFWHVAGVYLGGEGQEGLIELRTVSLIPGTVGGVAVPATMAPEHLLRDAVVYVRRAKVA